MDSGNFAFTASESGDYSACFWVQDTRDTPSVVTIEFEKEEECLERVGC